MLKQIGIILLLIIPIGNLIAQDEFITTWQVNSAGESITIPTTGSGYNYTVDWGDGTIEVGLTGDATHTYTLSGIYTVKISGDFPQIFFSNNSASANAILTIEQWGAIAWSSMVAAFRGCTKLTINATDAPDLSACTLMFKMFESCDSLNQDINHWNVSTITNMRDLFNGASTFNQSLNNWDVRNVTTMYGMFSGALAFNGDISGWNVSKVESMSEMFKGATAFNGNISGWNVSSVTQMSSMFEDATAFNQPIGNWDLSGLSRSGLRSMFSGATAFNQSLNNWNTASLTNMAYLFKGATAFNGDISGWDVSKVKDMISMFEDARSFNQDLSNWNTVEGDDLSNMFKNAVAFNGDISTWNLRNAYSIASMFENASAFDQNLANWRLDQSVIMTNLFDYSGLSASNYDRILMSWPYVMGSYGARLGAAGIHYCNGGDGRQYAMDTYFWTITDAGVDCNTTWEGSAWNNGTPFGEMNALISADYDTYTEGAINCTDLEVAASSILTIQGGQSVSISGDLVNGGNIIVKDSSALVQTGTSPSNSGTGTYTVEKETSTFQEVYNYWSSPVQHTTINAVFGATGQAFYDFDAVAQTWQEMNANTALTVGMGFIATGVDETNGGTVTRTFSDNTGFNSGTITITPEFDGTAGESDKNWNLIGNPYPSGIDATLFLSDNSSVIENAVYLWSSDGTDFIADEADYMTMNAAGTVNAGGSGVMPSSSTIASCQGFFVQTLAAGDITFQNSQRTSTNNTFQRIAQTGARAWITVTLNDQISNEILLGFFEDGKWEKDRYDAAKLSGNTHLSFYSQQACTDRALPCPNSPLATSKWAIQGLPSLTTTDALMIPLGLEAKTAGKYTFSLNHLANFPEEAQLYLHDALTETSIHLQKETYTLELDKETYENRFYLRVMPSRVTSLVEKSAEIGARAYAYQDQIYIQFHDQTAAKASIGVYAISGKLIYKRENESASDLIIPMTQGGIYIVRVENKQGVLSKKLLIE
ncbi:MAG: BspA family leucine-rich repeat surface protein [Flammeovirgaceae bacterium]